MGQHALLIGVSQFEDERLARLIAPESDISALAAVLRDSERGNFDSVAVSFNDDVLTVRDKIASLFDSRHPKDLILLYYSGHGILGWGNRLFLATPGSNLDRPQTRSISATDVRYQMDQTRAESQVVVLDCCHSGAFAEGMKGPLGIGKVIEESFDAHAVGRYVLAAADTMQFAWDGGSLRAGGAADGSLSRFTAWLVDGIGRGEAAPEEDRITTDAVFQYLCRRARAEGSQAIPQRYVDRGTGDIVIARNPAAGPPWHELLDQLASEDEDIRMHAAQSLSRLPLERIMPRSAIP